MRISVDGSRIRNNKVAFSNLSGGLSMCISRKGDWSMVAQRYQPVFLA